MSRRAAAALGLAALAVGGGCRGRARSAPRDAAGSAAARDAGSPDWPELAGLPRATPIAAFVLPGGTGRALADAVGPVVVGDLAVIGTSQLGFAAIDLATLTVAWRRGAGAHLAPPLPDPDGVLLVGECEHPPLAPSGRVVAGCWRVVTTGGIDRGAGVLFGDAAAIGEFVAARGRADLVRAAAAQNGRRVRWTRGPAAVELDLDTGAAIAAVPAPVPVTARQKGRAWHIAIEPDAELVARDDRGAEAWRMHTHFAAVVGVLPGLAYEVPMVRVLNPHGAAGRGFIDVVDIEVTGGTGGQAGTPVPGIEVLGHASSGASGASAIAVRLDTSIQRDFVAVHDGRGGLAWVWPLPEVPRADPVGLAFADDGNVVVFHDGTHLAVLPGWAALENPTP